MDGVAGGSSATGTITSAGLYTPPSSPGTHVVSAVSSSNASFNAQATVAVTDLAAIWTYHTDNARTGQNRQEYALTPSTVSSGQFGKRWTCKVDGAVYAQPLYVANLVINGAVHNVLFVATSNDSVYAFNADDPGCSTFWHVSYLGAPGVTTSVPSVQSCGDIAEYGITPTPVIDTAAGTMYVLVATTESGTYVQRLHALDVTTGVDKVAAIKIQGSVPGSPFSGLTDTFNAEIENPRPGMLLTAGGVYLGWSALCDNYPWQGWFMRYDASSLSQTAIFNVSPNGYGGGIWMSAGAPAVDSGGSIYLSTGNGTFDDSSNVLPPGPTQNDFGMSLIRLNPSLIVQDFFTPAQNAAWSTSDYDLSAAGITVLPDGMGPTAHPNLLIGGDKQGHVYVVDRGSMSGFNSTSNNVVQYLTMPNIMSSCFGNGGECLYATPAYYNGTVYLGTISGPLLALPLSSGLLPADGTGTVVAASQTGDTYGFPNPTATISASPSGGGIVWVLDNSKCGTDDCGSPVGAAVLRAYDAGNLGNTLYSSTALAADQGGPAIKFTVPVVANGHVYVGGSGVVTVYGLAP